MMSFNRVDLSSCRCEASLPGYRGESIVLGYRSPLDNPDIGVITMSPLEDVKGTTVSLNTLNAPDKAMEAFKKAGKELQKEEVDYGKVGEYLREAIKLFPEFAAAWQILGETELALGQKEKARECFQKAMGADPNYVTPYIALAEMEVGLNQWDEAVQLTDQAIALNPYVIRAYYFRAISKYYLQQDTEAEVALRKVLESEDAPLYPASHYLLGGILADRRSYEAAAAEFRLFLKTWPHEHLANQVGSRLQEWESQGLIKPSPEESTPASEN
jgi:tetratricopeptide (TPR) repeat protein